MYKVIIVDDEPHVRDRIANRMPWRELGFEVIFSAESGEEALRMARQAAPDALLTDIRMPGMSGLELLHRFRLLYPQTRTAVMSAHDDFNYAKDAIRLGVKGYLLKPVISEEFAELFAAISRELAAHPHSPSSPVPGVPDVSGRAPDLVSGQPDGGSYTALAQQFVAANYEESIRLEDVARHLHLNPKYFSSLFKRETGINFIDYVNEVRINKAKAFLIRGEERISDISVRVGFANFSYFNKIFKRITGLTPLEYQRKHGV